MWPITAVAEPASATAAVSICLSIGLIGLLRRDDSKKGASRGHGRCCCGREKQAYPLLAPLTEFVLVSIQVCRGGLEWALCYSQGDQGGEGGGWGASKETQRTRGWWGGGWGALKETRSANGPGGGRSCRQSTPGQPLARHKPPPPLDFRAVNATPHDCRLAKLRKYATSLRYINQRAFLFLINL